MSVYGSPFGDFHLRSEIPYFCGEYVDWWIYHTEWFFYYRQVIPEHKVRVAEVYLVGEALRWYRDWNWNARRSWRGITWESFITDLKNRFGQPDIITSRSEILHSMSKKLDELDNFLSEMMAQNPLCRVHTSDVSIIESDSDDDSFVDVAIEVTKCLIKEVSTTLVMDSASGMDKTVNTAESASGNILRLSNKVDRVKSTYQNGLDIQFHDPTDYGNLCLSLICKNVSSGKASHLGRNIHLFLLGSAMKPPDKPPDSCSSELRNTDVIHIKKAMHSSCLSYCGNGSYIHTNSVKICVVLDPSRVESIHKSAGMIQPKGSLNTIFGRKPLLLRSGFMLENSSDGNGYLYDVLSKYVSTHEAAEMMFDAVFRALVQTNSCDVSILPYISKSFWLEFCSHINQIYGFLLYSLAIGSSSMCRGEELRCKPSLVYVFENTNMTINSTARRFFILEAVELFAYATVADHYGHMIARDLIFEAEGIVQRNAGVFKEFDSFCIGVLLVPKELYLIWLSLTVGELWYPYLQSYLLIHLAMFGHCETLFLIFSLPRPPELSDLEDKVILKDRGVDTCINEE